MANQFSSLARIATCSALLTAWCFGSGIAATDSYEFDYKTIWLVSAKLNQFFDPDSVVDDYIHLFSPGVWQKYHTDEFAFKKKEEEGLSALKVAVRQFDLTKPISLRGEFTLGSYDFEQKVFPITNFSSGSFFFVDQNCCQVIPSRIKVTFNNTDHFASMPLPEAEAKKLLERRTAGLSNDRHVDAEIFFVPSSVTGEDEVVGNIVKITYSDPLDGGKSLGVVSK